MGKNSREVGLWEKTAFGMANLGNIPVMVLVSSFLLIFYTNVVGLDPAACATLFLITRIIDAVNDPLIGFLLDRFPNTKYGKFRVTLIIGSVLCALNYLLLWFGPLCATSFKLGIAYISYLLLGVLFPVMDISLNSMLPVMTRNMKERSSLSMIKGTVYTLGGIAVGIVAPIVIGDASESEGYEKLILGVFVVILVFSVVGALGMKERITPTRDQKYNVKELFKILTLRPVLVVFVATLFYTIGTNIMTAVNAYFYTYVVEDFQLMSLVSLISTVLMFPGLAISAVLSNRYGKKITYIIGLLFVTVSPLLKLADITNIPLLMVSSGALSFGTGILMGQMYSILADNTDYVEFATRQRAEGAVASLNSFMSKFAMGIGGALPGYILAWAGFEETAQMQSIAVNNVLIGFTTYIPALCSLLATLIFGFLYPLTKEKLQEQMEELNRRHNSVATEE